MPTITSVSQAHFVRVFGTGNCAEDEAEEEALVL